MKRTSANLSSDQSRPQRNYALISCAKSIIFSYMNYKRTNDDANKFISTLVKSVHKTICQSGNCKCGNMSSALFHLDACCDQECSFCNTLWRSFNTLGVLKRYDGSKITGFPNKRVKIVYQGTQSVQPSPESDVNCWLSMLVDDERADNDTCISSEEKTELVYLRGDEMDSAKGEKAEDQSELSILEFLTGDELRAHLSSLRPSCDQDIEGNKMMNPCNENSCNLCGMERLIFEPKKIYCSSCTMPIKKSVSYYFMVEDNATKLCVCATCFRNCRTVVPTNGKFVYKSELQVEKNNLAVEEAWVQCDKCEAWQHQICGLYNVNIDTGGKAEYVCPKCYLLQIKAGEHVPIQKDPTFGAKNLPTNKLSDYIEKRLSKRLNQERQERAKAFGKGYFEVPGVNDVFIRVIVSANKLLKVNEQFLEFFHNQKFPSEFPYRSKVILMFQKIDGIDVCLFALYTQEYGPECGVSNQRTIYISQIDSVKHFRPEIKSAYGEALRTFVYHEILIGYLDYCKKRGFSTAYIWSCPPMKGDDYIFYCHPESQKTPRPDQLWQWYKSMLKKAAKENIVVDSTEFYDHYFVPNEEINVKVSAARLPYFEGACWTGEAIGLIKEIEIENQANSKKKLEKAAVSRRTLKALGFQDLDGDATKDILLMEKLGGKILPSKEDFLMIHLQVTCKHCHELILSELNWLCKKCNDFLLCSKCHKSFGYRYSHRSKTGQRHNIYPAMAPDDIAVINEDADAILETIHFEDRNNFLSFCQGTQLRGSSETTPYQFDSLRRAKHSSMMILHYLHGSIKKVGVLGGKNGNPEMV